MIAKPKVQTWTLHVLDIVYWVTFLIYLAGGISIAGRLRLAYIADLSRLGAFLGIVATFGFNLQLKNLTFSKAFHGLDQWLRGHRAPNPILAGFALISSVYLIALFFLDPILDYAGNISTWFFDLGLMEQIIWRKTQGLGFTTTAMGDGTTPLRYFPNNHLNFLLFPISWIYSLIPRAETLIVLKSVALLSAMIPLWKIGDLTLPKRIPRIVLPLLYWSWDSMHRVNVWHFHETPFMSAIGLWAYYFFLKRKWAAAFTFTVGMALLKEDAWITAGAMGLYFLFSQRKWVPGIAAFLAGCAVFFFHAAFLNHVNTIPERYSFLGNNFSDALRILSSRPWILVQYFFRDESRPLLMSVLFAGSGTWLLSGLAAMPVLPILVECACSTLHEMARPESHHIVGLGAPLFGAIAIGFGRLCKRFESDQNRTDKLVAAILLFSIAQLSFNEAGGIRRMISSPEWQTNSCRNDVFDKIPTHVPLLASPEYGARVSRRKDLHLYLTPIRPIGFSKAWILARESAPLPHDAEVVFQHCGMKLAKPLSQ